MLGLARTAAAEAGNSRALSFFLSRGKTRVAGSQCRRAAVMVAGEQGERERRRSRELLIEGGDQSNVGSGEWSVAPAFSGGFFFLFDICSI